MKFSAVAGAFLFAEVAFAARFTERRRARLAQRAANASPRSAFGKPMMLADGNAKVTAAGNKTDDLEYSSNWSGAVLIGTGYTSVTGTFVVPEPSAPSGGDSSTQYAASAWVGIDGDTAHNSILQTGIDFYSQDGEASFDAWYEWYPDYAYNFDNFDVSVGDTITVTVTATSKKAGKAVIKNASTGQSVSHTFSSESNSLEELNAEWIIEDFEEGGSLVPFADFGTVTFTDATATTSSGKVGPDGATLMDIKQSGKILTSASISDGEVTITYVG